MPESVQLSPALSPPRHGVTRNPRETCRARAGPRVHKNKHIYTQFPFIHPVSNGLSDHLFNTVNKQDKSWRATQAMQCHFWMSMSTWNTHMLSSLHMSECITRKRKRLPKCIFVFPKLFHSAGFHKRNIKAPPKFFFSHLFPIFRLAFGLCPWGKVWEAIFALELFTLPSSFSRHGRVPKGGFNPAYLECLHPTPLWW